MQIYTGKVIYIYIYIYILSGYLHTFLKNETNHVRGLWFFLLISRFSENQTYIFIFIKIYSVLTVKPTRQKR